MFKDIEWQKRGKINSTTSGSIFSPQRASAHRAHSFRGRVHQISLRNIRFLGNEPALDKHRGAVDQGWLRWTLRIRGKLSRRHYSTVANWSIYVGWENGSCFWPIFSGFIMYLSCFRPKSAFATAWADYSRLFMKLAHPGMTLRNKLEVVYMRNLVSVLFS